MSTGSVLGVTKEAKMRTPSLILMLLDKVGQVLGKDKMLWSTRERGIKERLRGSCSI